MFNLRKILVAGLATLSFGAAALASDPTLEPVLYSCDEVRTSPRPGGEVVTASIHGTNKPVGVTVYSNIAFNYLAVLDYCAEGFGAIEGTWTCSEIQATSDVRVFAFKPTDSGSFSATWTITPENGAEQTVEFTCRRP